METDKINEHIIKLTGKVSINKKLSIDKNYKIRLDGDITETSDISNQDGTFNRQYKFEPLTCEIENENGQKVGGNVKSKTHAKIRGRHHIWRMENNSELDYDKFGRLLVLNFDEVMDLLNKLNGER